MHCGKILVVKAHNFGLILGEGVCEIYWPLTLDFNLNYNLNGIHRYAFQTYPYMMNSWQISGSEQQLIKSLYRLENCWTAFPQVLVSENGCQYNSSCPAGQEVSALASHQCDPCVSM